MSGDAPGRGFARDALLVAGAAILLYAAAGAAGWGFVNYDDPAVVHENPVQSWSTMGRAFTERMAHAWLPMYSLSLGLDNALFGTDRPGAYHLHSVLLHALNAVLVVALARALGAGRRAALVAGIVFAIHPAVTESVAWVASRKDLLSFAFAAGAALVFLRAEEEPRRPGLHLAGVALLALGMLSKGTVVVLPALLVLAVLGRTSDAAARRRGLLGTIPYFVVAGSLAAVHYAIAASEGAAGASLGAGDTFAARAAAALFAFGHYVFTCLYPFHLSVEHGIGPGTVDGEAVVRGVTGWVVLAACAFLILWRRRHPGSRTEAHVLGLLVAGVLVSLAPFNGIFPRTTVMYAERYLYVPVALASGLFAWWLAGPVRWKSEAFRKFSILFVAVGFAGLTFHRLPVWRDSTSLWENAVARAPESHLAHAKLGEALVKAASEAGDPAEGAALYGRGAGEHRAAAERARSPLEELRARGDLGLALLGAGDPAASVAEFEKALALLGPAGDAVSPGWRADLEVNRAKALEAAGRPAEAVEALERIVRGDPTAAKAWLNLGVMRTAAGDLDGARAALLRATKEDPGLAPARIALADLEAVSGDFAAALRIAVRAAEVSPKDTNALVKCGEIAFYLGQPAKSEEWFRRALALAPEHPGARRGVAGTLAFRSRAALAAGHADEAAALARSATESDPGAPEPWFALGDAQRVRGDATAALEAYLEAGRKGAGPRAATARAAVFAAKALAERSKGNAAEAWRQMEKALAEKPAEIRLGGKRAPVKEGLERIPEPPIAGPWREPLLEGILALAAGEPEEARKLFDAALGFFGHDNPPVPPHPLEGALLVLRSRARVLADDLDGAVSDLDTLAREAPQDARAKFLLGHTLSARAARRRADGRKAEGDADSARAAALLEEARKIDPALVEASLALAERHFVEGRAVDAIRELNGVLERDPERVEAHLVLGNIMKAQFAETRERSFYEQGREHFLRALSSDATDARALSGLGEMAAFANKPKEALAYTLRALNADPEHPSARALAATLFVRTGRGRLEEGDVDGALESAKRADEMGGETAALCLLRADIHRRKNDWARAGSEVERARTLAPKDPDVRDAVAAHYRDVGYAFLLRKRHDQAEEAFRRALAAQSERVDLSEVRRILERGGEEAELPGNAPSAAVAEALDRAFEEARRAADEGVAAHRAGDVPKALAKFRESLRSFETPHARFGLGLCLAAAGNAADAEAEYRRAVVDDPEYAEAWLNLGALLYKRGADVPAEEAYVAYLKVAPKTGAEETVVKVEALLEALRRRRLAGEKR